MHAGDKQGCDKANLPEVLLFFANEDLGLDFLTYYTSFFLYRIREKKNSNIGIKYIGRVSVSEMMISMRKKNEMQNHFKSTSVKMLEINTIPFNFLSKCNRDHEAHLEQHKHAKR